VCVCACVFVGGYMYVCVYVSLLKFCFDHRIFDACVCVCVRVSVCEWVYVYACVCACECAVIEYVMPVCVYVCV